MGNGKNNNNNNSHNNNKTNDNKTKDNNNDSLLQSHFHPLTKQQQNAIIEEETKLKGSMFLNHNKGINSNHIDNCFFNVIHLILDELKRHDVLFIKKSFPYNINTNKSGVGGPVTTTAVLLYDSITEHTITKAMKEFKKKFNNDNEDGLYQYFLVVQPSIQARKAARKKYGTIVAYQMLENFVQIFNEGFGLHVCNSKKFKILWTEVADDAVRQHYWEGIETAVHDDDDDNDVRQDFKVEESSRTMITTVAAPATASDSVENNNNNNKDNNSKLDGNYNHDTKTVAAISTDKDTHMIIGSKDITTKDGLVVAKEKQLNGTQHQMVVELSGKRKINKINESGCYKDDNKDDEMIIISQQQSPNNQYSKKQKMLLEKKNGTIEISSEGNDVGVKTTIPTNNSGGKECSKNNTFQKNERNRKEYAENNPYLQHNINPPLLT